MAAFRKSVEEITVSVPAGIGLQTVETNLTKGQDAAKCVPFFSMYYTNNGTPNRLVNNLVSVETYDNAGTAAVRVRRSMHSADPDGDVEVVIYVVEFSDDVTVQKGVVEFPEDTRSVTDGINAVVQGNSFIVCSQHQTGTFQNNDWGQAFLGARFNSNTQIQFDRNQGTLGNGMQYDVYWYVVESNGTDFQTEFVEYDWASNESGPSAITLSNSVDLDHSFVVPTYFVDGYTDQALQWGLGVALTGPTTLEFNRDGGGSKNRSGTIQAWVVRSDATAVNTQRFESDVTGVTITDEFISAVDLSKAIVMDGGHCGTNSAFATLSSTSGARQYQALHSLRLTSTTNVRLQRRSANISGTNLIQVEVVELEEATGAQPVTGTAAQTLPSISQSASAVETIPATGDQTLPSVAQNAVCEQTISVAAQGAQGLPSLNQSAAAVETIPATAAQTLPSVTQAAVASEIFVASAAQGLQPVSQNAICEQTIFALATGEQTLGSITQSAIAVESMQGVAAQTLAAVTQQAEGIMLPVGTGSQTLPGITQMATGVVVTGAETYVEIADLSIGIRIGL